MSEQGDSTHHRGSTPRQCRNVVTHTPQRGATQWLIWVCRRRIVVVVCKDLPCPCLPLIATALRDYEPSLLDVAAATQLCFDTKSSQASRSKTSLSTDPPVIACYREDGRFLAKEQI